MTFPFVSAAVGTGDLVLHGLWNDIVEGTLESYDAAGDRFVPI